MPQAVQAASLFAGDGSGRGALIDLAGRTEVPTAARPASLFADRDSTSLFAPVIRRHVSVRGSFSGSRIDALRDLIAKVEAGAAQYDAVVFSAHIRPPKRPTRMTIAEIYRWIDDTPGQNHAIGRYQFIPSTLRALVRRLQVPAHARFTPALQDRLADALLVDAGLPAFLEGEISHRAFMNNLAKIWAGLPNSTGRSHYAGIAGNKAGMSWTRFRREMKRIFPG